VEDGGEQIVISVMAWFVFLLPERLQSGTIAKPTSGRHNDVTYELNSTR
jgi:hypothetical protein